MSLPFVVLDDGPIGVNKSEHFAPPPCTVQCMQMLLFVVRSPPTAQVHPYVCCCIGSPWTASAHPNTCGWVTPYSSSKFVGSLCTSHASPKSLWYYRWVAIPILNWYSVRSCAYCIEVTRQVFAFTFPPQESISHSLPRMQVLQVKVHARKFPLGWGWKWDYFVSTGKLCSFFSLWFVQTFPLSVKAAFNLSGFSVSSHVQQNFQGERLLLPWFKRGKVFQLPVGCCVFFFRPSHNPKTNCRKVVKTEKKKSISKEKRSLELKLLGLGFPTASNRRRRRARSTWRRLNVSLTSLHGCVVIPRESQATYYVGGEPRNVPI